LESLQAYAENRGHSVLDLAIAWLAAQPIVGSVIAGATQLDQLDANVAAAEWRLTTGEAAQITLDSVNAA
jgi:aryl-alcohol dehydrogenase-like predicted oxidoreductase